MCELSKYNSLAIVVGISTIGRVVVDPAASGRDSSSSSSACDDGSSWSQRGSLNAAQVWRACSELEKNPGFSMN